MLGNVCHNVPSWIKTRRGWISLEKTGDILDLLGEKKKLLDLLGEKADVRYFLGEKHDMLDLLGKRGGA